jgi:hypothetical protein
LTAAEPTNDSTHKLTTQYSSINFNKFQAVNRRETKTERKMMGKPNKKRGTHNRKKEN